MLGAIGLDISFGVEIRSLTSLNIAQISIQQLSKLLSQKKGVYTYTRNDTLVYTYRRVPYP